MSERWSDVLAGRPDLFQTNSIIGLFRLAAEQKPGCTAAADEQSRLTYRELEHRSNQAARALREAGARVYSEEELEEIRRQEELEAQNSWIEDDIDFDEFDEYYDEEK